MISTARTSDFRRGFSLIEIVIVLGLAAMISAGAITFMVYSSDERVLRDVSGDIEVMAKRARTVAILQQTPYALEFREGRVRLLPFAEAGKEDDRKTALGYDIGGQEVEETPSDTRYVPVREQHDFPEEMAVAIRRWNAVDWIPLAKNALQIWRFDPDGLCEPVSLRYTIEKGWAEDSFHPLTATIRDSQLEVR